MNIIIFSLAAIILTTAVSVSEAHAFRFYPSTRVFNERDTDKDGFISMAEFTVLRFPETAPYDDFLYDEKAFKAVDFNRDDRLSLREFKAVRRKHLKYAEKGVRAEKFATLFNDIDTDKNGFLNPDEFKVLHMSDTAPYKTYITYDADVFKMLDVNKDGRLVVTEFQAAYQKHFENARRKRKAINVAQVTRSYVPTSRFFPTRQVFNETDADQNGFLNRDEFTAVRLTGKVPHDDFLYDEKAFGSGDADKDNRLSFREFQVVYQKHFNAARAKAAPGVKPSVTPSVTEAISKEIPSIGSVIEQWFR